MFRKALFFTSDVSSHKAHMTEVSNTNFVFQLFFVSFCCVKCLDRGCLKGSLQHKNYSFSFLVCTEWWLQMSASVTAPISLIYYLSKKSRYWRRYHHHHTASTTVKGSNVIYSVSDSLSLNCVSNVPNQFLRVKARQAFPIIKPLKFLYAHEKCGEVLLQSFVEALTTQPLFIQWFS